MEAAENFLWMVKYWSSYGGWVTSSGNMILGILAIYADVNGRVTPKIWWEPNLTQTEFFEHPDQAYVGTAHGRRESWPTL